MNKIMSILALLETVVLRKEKRCLLVKASFYTAQD
jgi:hypothetical protein